MFFRSILFYIFIVLWTIFMGIICLPYLILPSTYLRKPIDIWIIGIFKLLELTCTITYEMKGMDKIPKKAVIIASKHQSAFETLACFLHIKSKIEK